MPLNNALQPERTPTDGAHSSIAPGNSVPPAPLSRAAVAFLQQSLVHQQRRRRAYRARYLRVHLDGEERWQVDPSIGIDEPFRVPLSASYLEVFGDDEDGALLLAVLPLPRVDVVEDGGVQHLSVTLEGGQTLTLEMAVGEEAGAEEAAYLIQMSYTESPVEGAQGGKPSAGPHPEMPA